MNFSDASNEFSILVCNEKTADKIRQYVNRMTIFLNKNSKLADSYILDYFVENLWTCLPESWLETVMKFTSDDLEIFLDSSKTIQLFEGGLECRKDIFTGSSCQSLAKAMLGKNHQIAEKCIKPWPLSLLAFRACAFSFSLPRTPVNSLKCVKSFIMENYPSDNLSKTVDWNNLDSAYDNNSGQHKNIPEFCRRHVKPKKQHEIFRMCQLAAAVAESFEIKHAIDIGSGQGHLSRFLALCYNINVATVEADESHVSSAAKFDKKALITIKSLKKHLNIDKLKLSSDADETVLPLHIEGSFTTETSQSFLNKIFHKSSEDMDDDFKDPFALLGLHTCGDLAPTILRLFSECEVSKAVLSVGCCYMKLTSDGDNEGYPLSSYVKSLPHHHLSYEAKEMACHALEMYRQRLKENGSSLKIHCYRAALEKCIVHHYPDKKHMGLRGVKNSDKLPFPEYAIKALSKVSCQIPQEFYSSSDVQSCLDKWRDVLVFYSIRLIIAPVIESLLLLDRMLFLYERGYPCCLIPLFDPSISPRNHVIVSARKAVNYE